MTEARAQTIANVVLVSAGIAAAAVVLKTPPLRRFAMRALRIWLGGSVPSYVLSTAHRAWVESAPQRLT